LPGTVLLENHFAREVFGGQFFWGTLSRSLIRGNFFDGTFSVELFCRELFQRELIRKFIRAASSLLFTQFHQKLMT
jgi:hypothetical protein